MRIVRRVLAGLLLLTLLFAVTLVGIGATYSPNTTIPPSMHGDHVVVNGLPLRVVQQGTGRDVLLIHGSPGSIEDWDPVADELAGSFRVTRFDRPGHGYSGDDGQYSFAHNADVAIAVIRALKLSNVIVTGHSYGGTTALAMALRHPPEVSAYVVVDSATYEPSRKADGAMRLLDVPLLGFGFGTIVAPVIAPKRIARGIAEQFEGKPPPGFVVLRTGIWTTPKVTHAIAVETLGAPAEMKTLSQAYPSIKDPLFIVAEADSPFRKATAEHLHGDVSGSTLRLVPGTGHYVQFEKPSEVVSAIRAAAEKTAPVPVP